MTFATTPWAIGGGAAVSAELARMQAYSASGKGNEGILDPGDLKVRAKSTAAASVWIADGGGIVFNRSVAGSGQSYFFRNVGDHDFPVANTAGAARSDMIVARIIDPQYSPWPPFSSFPDMNAAVLVEPFLVTNVPSTAKKVMDLNGGAGLGYSAVALARIDRPAGSTTVLGSQIVDLRKVAQPRRQRELRTYSLVSGDGTSTLSNATDQAFPSAGSAAFALDIPEWATRCRIVAQWNQVRVPTGNVTSYLWIKVGTSSPFVTQSAYVDTPNAASTLRSIYSLGDDQPIPSAMRGTTQTFSFHGSYNTGVSSARIQMDSSSSVYLDVEFYESAV